MFAQEQSDQGLKCLLNSSLIKVYSVDEEQSHQGLRCLLKSSLIRGYSVCSRAI